MIYTAMTKKALCLCFEAHKDQLDKSGLPYVFHPFHLAEQMTDEVTTIVALLHDVVEDTPYTLADIEMEFGKEVTDALRLLTHDKNVKYSDYVRNIKISHACYLLRNTRESVIDIASQCGYFSISSFNRNFKQMTGFSPTAYRDKNNHAKKEEK